MRALELEKKPGTHLPSYVTATLGISRDHLGSAPTSGMPNAATLLDPAVCLAYSLRERCVILLQKAPADDAAVAAGAGNQERQVWEFGDAEKT